MAENSTLARPYAQAAFEIAQAQDNLAGWSKMLNAIASVVADESVQSIIGNPRVSKAQLTSLVTDVCGEGLDQQGRNFVSLVIENDRLVLMPEILSLFEQQRAEAEATLQAEVISAFELSKAQEASIAAALKKRLGREVTLTSRKDDTLLGGAVIRAGDLVIDGSVTSQLNKLAGALAG